MIRDPGIRKKMRYNLFKLFHIVGIVAWLGPSTGVYYMIIYSVLLKESAVEIWLRQQYLSLINIQIAGLIILISSGVLMVIATGWVILKQWWLRTKVFIVVAIFIPLELIQVFLYHSKLMTALEKGTGFEYSIQLFDAFSVFSIALLTIAVPLVLVLSIFKPEKKR
jgi:uncharacterized membrane protein